MSQTDDAAVVMSGREADEFVVSLIQRSGPLTTREIEIFAAQEGRRCPDQTVVYLTKLMRRGLVNGEVSVEKRGWIWSVPQPQTPPG
ncbi:MAG TPA: hypothetical protein VMW71_02170 [Thermoplasmata archaeon]|nr:hypothetical protein [Thermoplasmata archaeon]